MNINQITNSFKNEIFSIYRTHANRISEFSLESLIENAEYESQFTEIKLNDDDSSIEFSFKNIHSSNLPAENYEIFVHDENNITFLIKNSKLPYYRTDMTHDTLYVTISR